MKKIVILISGRGSNMEALIAARDAGQLPVNIAAVISNRPDAAGLETAARAGITAHFIDHKAFAGRGHKVTIIERSGDLGGVWEPVRSYPDVQTQSPKELYR